MPEITRCIVDELCVLPEKQCLLLPSDFTSKERDKYTLHHMAVTEMRLREGEANDAIRMLHMHVRHGLALRHAKSTKKDRNMWALQPIQQNKELKFSNTKMLVEL